MSEEHSPTPWTLHEREQVFEGEVSFFEILDAEGKYVVHMDEEADVRRIVACVNACAGFSTEMLEKIVKAREARKP